MLKSLASVLALMIGFGPLSAAAETACPSFTLASQGLPTRGEWRTRPAVADVNGDGHPDIAGHIRKGDGPRVFLGDGKGTWRPGSKGLAIPSRGCGVGVALADVNGDGHVDLGLADHCRGLFVFLGDGKGEWRMAPIILPADRRGFEDLAFADMDGDGHTDIVGVGSFRGGITFLAGDGTGGFKPRDVGLPKGGYAKKIALGDLNGDGQPDVLASYSGGSDSPGLSIEAHRNLVWLSGPDGRYAFGSEGLPRGEGQFRGVALGDVDEDGILDLALASTYTGEREPLLVFLGDGKGNWKPAIDGLPPVPPNAEAFTSYNGVALADLNGDGHIDLAAHGYYDPLVSLYLGDGKGSWRACSAEQTGLPQKREVVRGWGIAAADVNHDSKTDLIVAFGRSGLGAIEVWIQR